jgi:MoxR-like ATPase
MDAHEARKLKDLIDKMRNNIAKVFVGKTHKINLMLMGFISGLHVLIEDVPGVGKTTLARCLATSTGLDFARIQFTPDLLPGDILGMTIWNSEKREMVYKPGAILHQFILADEINRATPRTQSALLEAMQEESVTIEGTTHRVPQPFFVIATQNPSHFIGAFMLPEAELDRFGVSFSLGYPDGAEGIQILDRFEKTDPIKEMTAVISPADILLLRTKVREVTVKEELKKYILEIASQSRVSKLLKLGISTRATQHLLLAVQAFALMQGRHFAVPEDIMELAVPVLSHRLILSAETRMKNLDEASVINEIVSRMKVPLGAQ